MSTKLVQKHLIKGSQTFELKDDEIDVRIKTPFKEEKLTVTLVILDPEPVINKSRLEFHSRVKCGPLLSFFLNNPNKEEFDAFIEQVKEKAQNEYNKFLG